MLTTAMPAAEGVFDNVVWNESNVGDAVVALD